MICPYFVSNSRNPWITTHPPPPEGWKAELAWLLTDNEQFAHMWSYGFGQRSFSVAGPDASNSLPRVIRCIVVPSTFKRRLKTEQFSQAYDVSLDISDD